MAVRFLIHQIRVGRRVRKDLGDLKGLAQSIVAVGLLHPIVVATGGKLIADELAPQSLPHAGLGQPGRVSG